MGVIEVGGIAALGCAVGLYPGIHHLLTFRKERKHRGPVEAVELIAEYIRRARSSIDIVSGELSPFVFNPLVPLICCCLESVPNLTLRVIASPRILGLKSNPSRRRENRLYNLAKNNAFHGRFQMRIARTRPDRHFGLVDTLHLYVEEPHASDEVGRDVTFYRNSGLTAVKFQADFDQLWHTVGEVPLEEVTVEAPALDTADPEEARRLVKEAESLPILQVLEAA